MVYVHVEKLTLPPSVTISEKTVRGPRVEVLLSTHDLPLPPFAADYYFYRLQYKPVGGGDSFLSLAGFRQHYNWGKSNTMSFELTLLENTEYDFRVALYRRVVLRGWLEVCDTTRVIRILTEGKHREMFYVSVTFLKIKLH